MKSMSDKKKLKHSVFMITINTNKTTNEDFEKIFEDSIKYVFSDDHIYDFLMDRREDVKKIIPGRIKSKAVKYGIEIAPNTKRLHAHIVVTIDHDGLILAIDQKKLREFYATLLGSKPHISIIARGNDIMNFEDYVTKGVKNL